MKKNILITLIIIIGLVILIDVIIIIDNDIQMNECLEIVVPKLTKREIVKLQNTDLFNDEKVIKIYLSKNQTQNILKKIEENVNWKNKQLDERLKERLEFHTREEIFYQIPNIENYY